MVITIQIQDKQDFMLLAPFLESLKTHSKAKVKIVEEPSGEGTHHPPESEKNGALPHSLKHIGEAIEGSKKILELAEDWDDAGALPIKKTTFKRASIFLINYSTWLFNNFKFAIETPQLSPGPDGSIDILWRTKYYRMLINIPQNKDQQAGYYGDDYKDGNSIKGKVPVEGLKNILRYG